VNFNYVHSGGRSFSKTIDSSSITTEHLTENGRKKHIGKTLSQAGEDQ